MTVWNLTLPTMEGIAYGQYWTGGANWMSSCAADGAFSVDLGLYLSTCPRDYFDVWVSIPRGSFTPPTVITLPNASVQLSAGNLSNGTGCYAWTGTLTWTSDLPTSSVTIDATCTQSGRSPTRLQGTISGDL